jgi:hypothetical protein
MSMRTVGGQCASSIGTYVLINSDGWIITAAHILKNLNDLHTAEQKTRAWERALAAGNRHDRRSGKANIPKKDDIDKWSVWYGYDGAQLDPSSIDLVESTDLAYWKISQY